MWSLLFFLFFQNRPVQISFQLHQTQVYLYLNKVVLHEVSHLDTEIVAICS